MIKQNVEAVKDTLKLRPFPLEVIVETVSHCNLSCIMCPQPKITRERGYMPLGMFEKIVDEIKEVSPKTRIWPAIMGEPLMDPTILDKLSYAAEAKLHICLNTNAMLLTPEMSKVLVDIGVKDFYVGLDAMFPATYAKIRVDGDFSSVVRNTIALINEAKKTDAEVCVQFIDMEENDSEMKQFISFWTGVGAVVKVRPRLGWGLGVDTDGLVLSDAERDFPCPWLNRTISIHWNGAVVQCDADWDDKDVVAHFPEKSIKQIWDSELAEKRERHMNLDFDFGNCKDCKDWQAGKSYFYYPKGR